MLVYLKDDVPFLRKLLNGTSLTGGGLGSGRSFNDIFYSNNYELNS